MYTLQTKVPERVGALFAEVCKERGKTPYLCLKDLVYRFLIEHGVQVYEDAPVEAKVEALKHRVDRLENEIEELRKKLDQIMQLEANKAGLQAFRKR